MSSAGKEITAFASGLIIGGTSAWVLLKNKYETFAEDKINTFKEDNKEVQKKEAKEKAEKAKNKNPITSYSSIVAESGYSKNERTDYTKPETVKVEEEEEEPEETPVTETTDEEEDDDESYDEPYENLNEPVEVFKDETPYIITSEEYDEVNGYDKVYISIYDDNVYADEVNNVIDNPEMYVGIRPEIYFDDTDLSYGDILYFRNDAKRLDTKLVRESVTYAESEF